MEIGDKVKAKDEIDSWLVPYVPTGSEGTVTDAGFGRLEVAFDVPGILGGTRQVRVRVEPGQIELVDG